MPVLEAGEEMQPDIGSSTMSGTLGEDVGGVEVLRKTPLLPEVVSFEEEMRRFEERQGKAAPQELPFHAASTGAKFTRRPSGQSVTSWENSDPVQYALSSPAAIKAYPSQKSLTNPKSSKASSKSTQETQSGQHPEKAKSSGKFERIPTSQLLELYSNAGGHKKKAKDVASRFKQPSTAPAANQQASSPRDGGESFEHSRSTEYMMDYTVSRDDRQHMRSGARTRRMYPKLKIPFMDDDRQIFFNSARACTTNAYQTLLSYRRSGVSHTISRGGAQVVSQSSMNFVPHSAQHSPAQRSRSRAARSRGDMFAQVRAQTSMAAFHDKKERPPSRVRGQRLPTTDELPSLMRTGTGHDGQDQFPGERDTLVMRRHGTSLRHPECYMSWLTGVISILEKPQQKRRSKSLREMHMLSQSVMLNVRALLEQVRTQWTIHHGLTHEFGNLYGQRKQELASLRRHLLGEMEDDIEEYDMVAPDRHVVRVYELMIRRFTARFNAQVKNSISRFWKVLPKNQHGCIAQKEYLRLHLKFFLALLPVCDVEYARRATEMDWLVDVRHGQDDPSRGLKHSQFLTSMFELADNWCELQEPEQVVVWLNKLWVAVIDDAGNLRDDTEIFHDERYWFDGIDPLGEANRWDYARIMSQGPRNTFFHGLVMSRSQSIWRRADDVRSVPEVKERVGVERSGENEDLAEVHAILERDGRLVTPEAMAETMAAELKELAHLHLPKYNVPTSPPRYEDSGKTIGDVLSGTEKMTDMHKYPGVDHLQPENLSVAQLRELQTLVHARVPTPSDLIGLRLKLENINIEDFGKHKKREDVFPKEEEVWPSLSKPTSTDVARYQEAKRRLQLEKEMRSRNSRFLKTAGTSKDQKTLKSFAERQEEKEQLRRLQGLEEFKRRKAQRIQASKKLHQEADQSTHNLLRIEDPEPALATESKTTLEDEYERWAREAGQLSAVPGFDGSGYESREELEEPTVRRSRSHSASDNEEATEDQGLFARLEKFANRRRLSVESTQSQEMQESAALTRILRSAEGSRRRTGAPNSQEEAATHPAAASSQHSEAWRGATQASGQEVKTFGRQGGAAPIVPAYDIGTQPPSAAQRVRRLPPHVRRGSPDLDLWETRIDQHHMPPQPLAEPPPSTPPGFRGHPSGSKP